MSAKSKGTARERQWAKRSEAEGWIVIRGAGSLGAADLIELTRAQGILAPLLPSASFVRLVQVKGNKGSPWMNFRRAERARLSALSERIGGIALMVHWPPRAEPRIYAEHEWPE